jgi:NADP-dependent 3-hydroxy acid dehydrogenase YdfG
MQESVHRQEGREYDPGRWIEPGSVADLVLAALDLPRDAAVHDLTVRPGR